MKTQIRFVFPAGLLIAGLFLIVPESPARPDYTRRTKQECSYCHPSGGWYLTDAGKYFRDHRDLNGYKPPAEPPKGSKDGKRGDEKSTAQNSDKSKSPGK